MNEHTFTQAELPRYLKHYTTQKHLWDILGAMALRLADPENWKERNDQASVRAFVRKKSAALARVLCLTSGSEVIHHWTAYAPGPEGCRIDFNTEAFLETLDGLAETCPYLLHRGVIYLDSRFDPAALDAEDIPFVKRLPYESDNEYRVVWAGARGEDAPEIPLAGLIRSITLSGELDDAGFNAAKARIAGLCQGTNEGVKVHHSALWGYQNWIARFDRL